MELKKKSHAVFSKFTILCWVTILGCMKFQARAPLGWRGNIFLNYHQIRWCTLPSIKVLSFYFLHIGIFHYFMSSSMPVKIFFLLVFVWACRGCGNSHWLILCCCWNPKTNSLFMLLKRAFLWFLPNSPRSHPEGFHPDCTSLASTKPGVQYPVPPNWVWVCQVTFSPGTWKVGDKCRCRLWCARVL